MTNLIRNLVRLVQSRMGLRHPLREPSASVFLVNNKIILVSHRQALDSAPFLWNVVSASDCNEYQRIGEEVIRALSLYGYYDGLRPEGRLWENTDLRRKEIDKSKFVGVFSRGSSVEIIPSARAGNQHLFKDPKITVDRANISGIGRAVAEAIDMSR
jgi:hypothetical protein